MPNKRRVTLGLMLAFVCSISATALADGDTDKGKRAFLKCRSCHSLEAGDNKTGPHLAGIFGRQAGAIDGYAFSDDLKNSGIVWDEKSLDTYITDPKSIIPKGKMSFAGIKASKQREDLIAYLKEAAK